MMTRGVRPLWAAFLTAHLVVAVSGWVLPNQPMGDVVLVYQPWAQAALAGGPVVGISETWVYPQLALLPMLLSQVLAVPLTPLLGASAAYLVGWALLVTASDAAGMAVLLGRGGVRARRTAGWFWTLALLLLGPIAMYRLDAITVPLAVAGGLLLGAHPRVASALLAIGAWTKIWPGALLLAAVVATRRRLRVLLAALAVTAAVVAGLLALGAGEHALGFLTEQTGRGLQIEAVAATPFLWAARGGGASIEYSLGILTYQIVAPGADAVAAAMTPVMIVVVGAVVLVGALRARAGAEDGLLLPPLALALVAALIVTNKVGSPQFATWLIAPVVLWLVVDRARAHLSVLLVLATCALTFCVYPLTYHGVLATAVVPVLLLTLRNILLVLLLVVALRAVLRAPRPVRSL